MTETEIHWAWFGPFLWVFAGFIAGIVYEWRNRKKTNRVWILQHRTNGQVHGVWGHSPDLVEIWEQLKVRACDDILVAQRLSGSAKVFSQEVL